MPIRRDCDDAATRTADQQAPAKTIVLVGLMGAGKSCIGKRLAQRLGLPFIDADHEIEQAAGCSIAEIFARHGEAHFRDGERRVIARLLDKPVHVLATGGGAFMDPRTRGADRASGRSRSGCAPISTCCCAASSRRNDRPLLQVAEPRQKLAELMTQRYPVYAEADITVDSADGPPDATLERVVERAGELPGERARAPARGGAASA